MSDRSPMPTAEAIPRPAAGRQRLDALDGLRGIAALGVVLLHAWMFSYGDTHRTDKGFVDLVFGELRVGVALFFVLSGYLLFRPFVAAALDGRAGPSLRSYAIRRAARILPAYWAAVIGAFFLLRHIDHPMQIGSGRLPVYLLFAQNQFEETIQHLDPPMWTLAVEVSFYLLLPLLGLLALRLGAHRGRQVALGLVLVALGALFTALAYRHAWPRTTTTSLLPHLGEFGAGMTVAALLHGRTLRPATAWAAMVAGIALIVANGTWHALGIGPQTWRSLGADLPGVVGMALVLAPLVAVSGWRAPMLSRGPARWLGTVSYGVYLVHFPVIVWLRATGHWPDTLPRQLVLTVGTSLAVATAGWFALERPVIRWARRLTTPRHRVPAPGPRREPRRQRTGELPALRPRRVET